MKRMVLAITLAACGAAEPHVAPPVAPPAPTTTAPTAPTSEPRAAETSAPAKPKPVDAALAPFFDGTWKVPSEARLAPGNCKSGDAAECFRLGATWETFRITEGKPAALRLAEAARFYNLGCKALGRAPCEPAARADAKRETLEKADEKVRPSLTCQMAIDNMGRMQEAIDARRIFRDDCLAKLAPACVKTLEAVTAVASTSGVAAMVGMGCGEEHYCKVLASEKLGYCALSRADRNKPDKTRGPVVDLLVAALLHELAEGPALAPKIRTGVDAYFAVK